MKEHNKFIFYKEAFKLKRIFESDRLALLAKLGFYNIAKAMLHKIAEVQCS